MTIRSTIARDPQGAGVAGATGLVLPDIDEVLEHGGHALCLLARVPIAGGVLTEIPALRLEVLDDLRIALQLELPRVVVLAGF